MYKHAASVSSYGILWAWTRPVNWKILRLGTVSDNSLTVVLAHHYPRAARTQCTSRVKNPHIPYEENTARADSASHHALLNEGDTVKFGWSMEDCRALDVSHAN